METCSVVTFASGEGPDSIIEGFTITNGSGTVSDFSGADRNTGGGIFCDSAAPKIVNCVITGNTLDFVGSGAYGGGVYCVAAAPMIADRAITENQVGGLISASPAEGGGVYCEGASMTPRSWVNIAPGEHVAIGDSTERIRNAFDSVTEDSSAMVRIDVVVCKKDVQKDRGLGFGKAVEQVGIVE